MITITKTDLQNLDAAELPHAVPSETGQSVLIRDGGHEGTVVVNLGHRGFAFHGLDGEALDRVKPRCVLVELAEPEIDAETDQEVCNWESALPTDALVGCDLEGKGYALLGVQEEQEIDERCGTVLWDSHAE